MASISALLVTDHFMRWNESRLASVIKSAAAELSSAIGYEAEPAQFDDAAAANCCRPRLAAERSLPAGTKSIQMAKAPSPFGRGEKPPGFLVHFKDDNRIGILVRG